jgi:uncharacterized membrane protein
MGNVTHSVDVEVPVRTAYNQWTQFEEFPKFMEGVERVKQLDDTHMRWHVDIAGIEAARQVPGGAKSSADGASRCLGIGAWGLVQ